MLILLGRFHPICVMFEVNIGNSAVFPATTATFARRPSDCRQNRKSFFSSKSPNQIDRFEQNESIVTDSLAV